MAEHRQPVVVLPGGGTREIERRGRLAHHRTCNERKEPVEEPFPPRIRDADDCPAIADYHARREGPSGPGTRRAMWQTHR